MGTDCEMKFIQMYLQEQSVAVQVAQTVTTMVNNALKKKKSTSKRSGASHHLVYHTNLAL